MGEMKKVKLNFTLDPLAELKASRKKAILGSKKIKAAMAKNKVEYKETIIVDSKKWDAKKLEKALQKNVALMELKMFDTACKDLDKGALDEGLEEKIIESYNSLMKRIRKNVNEQMETVINDKPDDKKLKKGVDALGKVDGRAPASGYATYKKWMKRCERNWGNIAKLEAGIKQHGAEHQKLSAEAEKQQKASDSGDEAAGSKSEKAKSGADNEKKVADKLTQKRDALLNENKNLYKEETGKLFKELEGVVSQLNQIVGFASEMKRNQQISDDAQKTITSAKGFYRDIKTQQNELKRAQKAFDAQMTKLERAKNAGARPSHGQMVVPQQVAKNIELACRQAADMHKKLKTLYKAAK